MANPLLKTRQIADLNVTNGKVGYDVARANLLVNGGFEIWQRGAGAFLTNNAWTADRWQLAINLSTCQIVQETTYQVSGTYCAKMVYTHVAGGYAFIEQKLEPSLVKSLRGKTVAFSVKAFTSVTGGYSVQLVSDGTGALFANAVGVGNGMNTLRCSGTVPTDANNLYVRLVSGSVTDNIWFDEAVLVPGTVAPDFVPLHPADDLARCQRYYEAYTSLSYQGYGLAGNQVGTSFPFKVNKATTPTITLTNNGSGNLNLPLLSFYTNTQQTFIYQSVVAAGTYAFIFNMTVEANP